MISFRDHPYVQLLLSLQLPAADYAVAGSGPLLARGWIDDPADIDVVARGDAWNRVAAGRKPVRAPYGQVSQVLMFGGKVEILDGWFPQLWPTDHLIDTSLPIDEIRCIPLEVVARTKKMFERPRDKEHLRIMAQHGFRDC